MLKEFEVFPVIQLLFMSLFFGHTTKFFLKIDFFKLRLSFQNSLLFNTKQIFNFKFSFHKVIYQSMQFQIEFN